MDDQKKLELMQRIMQRKLVRLNDDYEQTVNAEWKESPDDIRRQFEEANEARRQRQREQLTTNDNGDGNDGSEQETEIVSEEVTIVENKESDSVVKDDKDTLPAMPEGMTFVFCERDV
jgi:hypothetical protein